MKQAGYSKRPRGRSFERRSPKNSHRESGSEGKSRNNNFQQTVDKYLTLAREAASSGDPVSAENYYQYADHYYRLAFSHRSSRSSDKQEENLSDVPPPASLAVPSGDLSSQSLEPKELA
jgi:hypothetical protein